MCRDRARHLGRRPARSRWSRCVGRARLHACAGGRYEGRRSRRSPSQSSGSAGARCAWTRCARASSQATSARSASPSSSPSPRPARLPGRRGSSPSRTSSGGHRVRERVLLVLPVGRSPPRGAILEATVRVGEPRSEEDGFDERGWLARQGIHVVLEASSWRQVGRRGGIAGLGDRLRDRVERAVGRGAAGVRRSIVLGVVLGEDEGLPAEVRASFRASGLYHLLAVSGQNVAFLAAGVYWLGWLLRLPRAVRETSTLVVICAYVLAVGWQPSVVRAGVAGALVSLAWLAARPTNRWHFFALGALVLLVWMPTAVLEPGFQLSFAAVAAIFVAVPRVRRRLDGLPVPAAAGGRRGRRARLRARDCADRAPPVRKGARVHGARERRCVSRRPARPRVRASGGRRRPDVAVCGGGLVGSRRLGGCLARARRARGRGSSGCAGQHAFGTPGRPGCVRVLASRPIRAAGRGAAVATAPRSDARARVGSCPRRRRRLAGGATRARRPGPGHPGFA